ncbi:hypothetical protein BDK51DRAFT_48056 [Blyttiomyces helicus]|uniref:Uncharacterized protein n=1 Tax=Blyttiomyces helicus TaxID=388810 RepID=A0A4P9VZW8_9FUNG|nr:hypothetical protein BDK51DRAFT_48056 [Blyttiomyces helicus]|eukprot:RKO85391.1 hypothetical protein BDK51DRAFT_48056 [Blyttiomyces helicus]
MKFYKKSWSWKEGWGHSSKLKARLGLQGLLSIPVLRRSQRQSPARRPATPFENAAPTLSTHGVPPSPLNITLPQTETQTSAPLTSPAPPNDEANPHPAPRWGPDLPPARFSS